VNGIKDRVQSVKVYQVRLLSYASILQFCVAYSSAQRRCQNLILRCDLLIFALREDNSEAPSSEAHTDALNEAQLLASFIHIGVVRLKLELDSYRILECVRDKVDRWANLNTVRSLLNQDDIREGVDELHRRVDTCIAAYHVLLLLYLVPVLIFLYLCSLGQNQPSVGPSVGPSS
jgi:hypothetical protein